jgi:hypothetical protein
LELPLHLVIDRLIEVGLLDIAETEEHEQLERALEKYFVQGK